MKHLQFYVWVETRIDLILPHVQKHVKKQQYKEVLERARDGIRNIRSFTEGENVLAPNYQGKVDSWRDN